VDVEILESGQVLDVGRARRAIPSAIGRALCLRDGGCNARGLEIQAAPQRSEDLEAIDHWLRTAKVEFERTPQWDGSRADVGEILSWMRY
jgi:hypothetical protein